MQQQGVGVGAVLPGIVVSAFLHWDRQGLRTTAIPSLQSTCLVQQSFVDHSALWSNMEKQKASFRELRLAHLSCTNFAFIGGALVASP